MNSTGRLRGWISGICLRVSTTALSLVVVLAPNVIANQLARAQTYTVLYSFTGSPDGEAPFAGLVRDHEGNLYGTTLRGGAHGNGTVFKISKWGKETVLYNFAGGTDGAYPYGGLIRDEDGTLYGTTYNGGNPNCFGGCGTVFKLDRHGKEVVLYRFAGIPDGQSPYLGTLLRDEDGNLFGTTAVGGDANCNPGWGCGTVFKLENNGRETILHTFTGISTGTSDLDGALPYAGLVRDAEGNFYGTTYVGGGAPSCDFREGCGTVFKLDKAGEETVLYRFGGLPDAQVPMAGVIRDAAGNIYGTTYGGGSNGDGTVFKLNKCNQETVLYSFGYSPLGTWPMAGLVRDGKGNLYGTTVEGGTLYQGTVFKLDEAGNETTLHDFTGWSDGALPRGTLVMDDDGNLYGTTIGGGNLGCQARDSYCGVVFKIAPSVTNH